MLQCHLADPSMARKSTRVLQVTERFVTVIDTLGVLCTAAALCPSQLIQKVLHVLLHGLKAALSYISVRYDMYTPPMHTKTDRSLQLIQLLLLASIQSSQVHLSLLCKPKRPGADGGRIHNIWINTACLLHLKGDCWCLSAISSAEFQHRW